MGYGLTLLSPLLQTILWDIYSLALAGVGVAVLQPHDCTPTRKAMYWFVLSGFEDVRSYVPLSGKDRRKGATVA